MRELPRFIGRLVCGFASTALVASFALAGTTQQDLKNDASTTDNVTTYGMGYGQQRYTTSDGINKDTVKKLVPVWNLSLNNSANASTQPLVIDGTMYVAMHDASIAIDAVSGKQLWKVPVELPEDVNGFLCCGIHSRGMAVLGDVLYRTTIDAFVMAIDIKSGKTIWRSKAGNYKEGVSMTHAPLVAGDTLITGMSGGEYGTRGFINGWDLKTGEKKWHLWTVAGPDDKGGDTWSKKNAHSRGGAPTWITGTYDPELDLVYWGTGNGGPWNPAYRGGDSLYICSALAIRPSTGELVWHFQFSPGDPFDYDSVNELVLADMDIGGKNQKVIIQANRNGFFYVLDRANGKLLAANQYAKKQNWAKSIDLKTGRPIDTPMTEMIRKTEEMADFADVWPSAFGSKNWMPMAYDPERKLAFANTLNFGFKYKTVKPEYKPGGAWYLGVEMGGWLEPDSGNRGFLSAIDPKTGKAKWEHATKVPYWSGVMATAGGLVFTGAQTGEFMAFDSDTGKKVWQFQTGSGITGLPISWTKDGKQYITVTSGSATVYGALGGDPGLKNVPAGGSVWTFSLLGD